MHRIFMALLFVVGLVSPSWAAAPARSGQPYAESICDTDPNILFCEDFNYPANFFCSVPENNGNHRWINPGWMEEITDFVYGCMGRQINPATSYPTKPQGHMPSGAQADHHWVANWDPALGTQEHGGSPGKLMLDSGGNYANGSGPVTDMYFRFQIYWTTDYAWPGDTKTHIYNWGTANCVDNKILFWYPKNGQSNPTSAAFDAGPYTQCGVWDSVNNARFADALVFRVGDAGDNYKWFPMNSGATENPTHMEYGPYQSLTLRNPNDVPTFGQIFRFNTGQWYTIETRYKLSTAGVGNGTIEAWIDGTKIYSASDLETCGNGLGDCSAIASIILTAYHNGSDTTVWDGQQVVDNLIISKAYIGPPGAAASTPVFRGAGSLRYSGGGRF